MREVLVVALVLVCPLMMIWMMRGHGHGHGHGTGDHDHRRRNDYRAASTDELRRQRDELEGTIAEREQFRVGRFRRAVRARLNRDLGYGPTRVMPVAVTRYPGGVSSEDNPR